jgi:hypothetical protein
MTGEFESSLELLIMSEKTVEFLDDVVLCDRKLREVSSSSDPLRMYSWP